MREAGQAGRMGVPLHAEPQSKSYLFAVIGAEYILNLLPRGTHDYAKFLKPSELAQYCEMPAELGEHHRHELQPAHSSLFIGQ